MIALITNITSLLILYRVYTYTYLEKIRNTLSYQQLYC